MNQHSPQPGVYAGVITARSSDEPGRDHTYSVFIEQLQLEFADVGVQEATRWSSVDDTLDLVPFPIGTDVQINAKGTGELIIITSELPNMGECE